MNIYDYYYSLIMERRDFASCQYLSHPKMNKKKKKEKKVRFM